MLKGNQNVVQNYTDAARQAVIANDYPLMTTPVIFKTGGGVIAAHTAMKVDSASGKWVVVAATTDKIEGISTQEIDTASGDVRSSVYQSGAFVVAGITVGAVDYGSDAVLAMNKVAVKPLFFVEDI